MPSSAIGSSAERIRVKCAGKTNGKNSGNNLTVLVGRHEPGCIMLKDCPYPVFSQP